jgi:hypothetical protein
MTGYAHVHRMVASDLQEHAEGFEVTPFNPSRSISVRSSPFSIRLRLR